MYHMLKKLLPVAALGAVLSITVAAQVGKPSASAQSATADKKGLSPQVAKAQSPQATAPGVQKPVAAHAPAVKTMLPAEQTAIVAQHGGECGVWVACVTNGVCGSMHCKGLAADLAFADDATQQWAHDHAADFGLTFPMSWEPWHAEPIGARG